MILNNQLVGFSIIIYFQSDMNFMSFHFYTFIKIEMAF